MKNILIILLLFTLIKISKAQNKPNFLFILTDDQTYESIHSLNNPEVQTPNMDKLVEQGVTFTHSFNQGSWSGAVCVASRSMLITGQNVFKAARNEAYLDGWAQLKENTIKTEVPLWTEVFKNNGYQTFITGKWHNSDYALLKGFDRAQAAGDGFYESSDENGERTGYNRGSADSEWKPWDTSLKGHWSPQVNDIVYDETGQKKTGPDYTVNQHTSELYADKAIQYLRNDAGLDSRPFFMYVAFNAPHDPRQSPKEFVDMYPPQEIQIPANYMAEHPFDQGDHKIRDEMLAPFPRTKEAVQLHRSEYYAIISHADHEIGRILTALEASGKMENTYVILTSDHGLAVGQHGLMGKQNQYDHSVRMPLIIMGPGLKAGKKIDAMVYMQSLFATTCDLAGIPIPETVDFGSLQNLMSSKNAKGEEYIFGAYKDLQRMIRSEQYKLIVYPHIKKIQLFDIEKDPHETTDLSGKKEFDKVKKQLFETLIQKQKELGDFMVLEEADYK
jgi:arylsulfatase A-like enzyme